MFVYYIWKLWRTINFRLYDVVNTKKKSKYDQDMTQSQTVDQLTAPQGRNTKHEPLQDKSKATSSLFLGDMIATKKKALRKCFIKHKILTNSVGNNKQWINNNRTTA